MKNVTIVNSMSCVKLESGNKLISQKSSQKKTGKNLLSSL